MPNNTVNPAQFAAKAEQVAQILKNLAHPQRLLVLCRLSRGEANVGQLQELLAREQAVVSHMLARLRRQGLVIGDKRGQQVFYRLADPCIARVLETLTDVYCGEMPR